MPHIYDNIDEHLLPALQYVLAGATAADFAVGHFNLRGWRALDGLVERFTGGDGNACRLLVGMQRLPEDDLKDAKRFVRAPEEMDNRQAIQLRKRLADEFRRQITFGATTMSPPLPSPASPCMRPTAASVRSTMDNCEVPCGAQRMARCGFTGRQRSLAPGHYATLPSSHSDRLPRSNNLMTHSLSAESTQPVTDHP